MPEEQAATPGDSPPATETIYADPNRGLTMEISAGYTPKCVDLLARTVWGSDGVRYRVHDIETQLDAAGDLRTIRLRAGDELVGCYGLVSKTLTVGASHVPAMHRTLLAVAAEHHGRGYGRLLVEQTKRYLLDSTTGPLLLYGYIETGNARSLKSSRSAGYRSVSTFASALFSRLNPKDDPAVEKLEDREEMVTLLEAAHRDHALLDFELSLRADEYWVVRCEGRIVAGVQAAPRRWTVVQLAGVHGAVLLRLLPHVPVVGRFMDGTRFNHLFFGNQYSAEGHEADFCRLLEALLARNRLYAALAFMDTSSSILHRLRGAGDFGLLGRAGLGGKAHVMAGFHDIPDAVEREIRRRALHISPTDPT